MAEPKKRYRMPAWIWKLPPSVLNGEDKRFLAFIWWCGFETCHCHNWYLALKFGFCKRTIQRRLAKLKSLKLVAVGCPDSWMRTIFPRALKDHRAWFAAMAGLKIVDQLHRPWLKTVTRLIDDHNKTRKPHKKSVTEG